MSTPDPNTIEKGKNHVRNAAYIGWTTTSLSLRRGARKRRQTAKYNKKTGRKHIGNLQKEGRSVHAEQRVYIPVEGRHLSVYEA